MTPSPGQLIKEREPTPSPAMPEGGYEVEFKNKRTNIVCLLPKGSQHRKLLTLACTSVELLKELNYRRRRQFSAREKLTSSERGGSITRSASNVSDYKLIYSYLLYSCSFSV
ncbi:hypothetical protein HS7_12210 [Sulfolobales archaeon HS-7]|nr:hypothetical protein HS7_12210 [Sulfolobales archaeon HS-7]